MQNIRSGLAFCKQAWGMARRTPELFKPSLAALLVSLVLTLLALIPIGLVVAFLRKTLPGILLTGFLCALLLCIQAACGELGGLATAYLFHRRLAQDENGPKTAWGLIRRAGFDLLIFSAALPVIAIQRWLKRKPAPGVNPPDSGRVNPERAWLEAAYLIMPAMAVENLSLKDSLQRSAQIVNDHLLRFTASTVGVNSFNNLVYALLGIVGFAAGLGVERWMHGVVGACGGIIIASLFSLAAFNLTSYNRAIYHTCLFMVAQSPEAAHPGNPAYDMLAAALQNNVK
jgi:hypothetical protein